MESLVRLGIALVKRFTGPHESAPSLTRKSSATKTTSEKSRTSTSPNEPSCLKTTANGYMKTISISKITNIIATRKNRTGNRAGGSNSGTMPHS